MTVLVVPPTLHRAVLKARTGVCPSGADGNGARDSVHGGDAKAKATWDGATLVVTTTRDVQGTTTTMKDVRSLSADGQEMTVVSTTAGMPQGGGSRKTVFTKS